MTDEDAAAHAAREIAEHGFHPPLDIVDGAAPIVDPINRGATAGEHEGAAFLEDYRPTDW